MTLLSPLRQRLPAGNTTAQTGGGDNKAPSASTVKIGGTEEDAKKNAGGNASAHSIAAHLKAMSSDYQAFSSGILLCY